MTKRVERVERACESCGGRYLAVRASQRFCGKTCGKRGQRGALLTLVAPNVVAPTGGTLLVQAVTAELESAGRLGSALGQAALGLAERLAESRDTGSAVASLTRELRATLAAAMVGARVADSPLERIRDEMRRRRSGLRPL